MTSRVYFTSAGASFGTALPSYLVGPFGQNPALQQSPGDERTRSWWACATIRSTASTCLSSTRPARVGCSTSIAFTEDGEQVASRHFEVPAYSQAGVNDTDLFTPDPSKRYVLKVTNSAGVAPGVRVGPGSPQQRPRPGGRRHAARRGGARGHRRLLHLGSGPHRGRGHQHALAHRPALLQLERAGAGPLPGVPLHARGRHGREDRGLDACTWRRARASRSTTSSATT